MCCKTAIDFKGPLKVPCGIWYQDVCSRSFELSKLRDGAAANLTFFSGTSHRCSIGLRYGDLEVQGNALNSSSCSSDKVCSVAGCVILLKEGERVIMKKCI